MSKKTILGVAAATLISAVPYVNIPSAYAIEGDVNLNVKVGAAVALAIHSSSDGSTTYGASDPESQNVMNYNGEGYTVFGTSSAKAKILPNQTNETMSSTVTVYSNSASGYKLTVSDADENTSLISGSYAIPASTNIVAGTSAWAFKGGKFAGYTAMTPLSTPLVLSESDTLSNVDGDVTTVSYGVSTSGDQATGTYTDTIVYTVTAEEPLDPSQPKEGDPTFSGIKTMQAMTSTICAAETTPALTATENTLTHTSDTSKVPTATVKDERDNKTYTIKKLADGNCWMTTDLALELTAGQALSTTSTDITTTKTPNNSTEAVQLGARSYGHYETGQWRSVKYNGNYYYDVVAATAGDYDLYFSQETESENVAQNSICPKNWQLPNGDHWLSTWLTETDYDNPPDDSFDWTNYYRGQRADKTISNLVDIYDYSVLYEIFDPQNAGEIENDYEYTDDYYPIYDFNNGWGDGTSNYWANLVTMSPNTYYMNAATLSRFLLVPPSDANDFYSNPGDFFTFVDTYDSFINDHAQSIRCVAR